ncbi:MAG: YciI family protein [Chloroflexota bacterium]
MKMYLLSVVTPTNGTQPAPEVLSKIMERVVAYQQELKDSGAWVFSGGLEAPSTATLVRVQDDSVLLTDGPFAEGKEYVGGFTIIKAADLDAALEWAGKAARAITLPIEVRPFQWAGGD